jgi:hypothetical protein
MKTSWTQTFRRLAAMSAVTVSAAVFSARCYALNAFDNASDPVYADGWQAGENGGSGFTAWNFDGTNAPSIHGIDRSSPFNDLGTSWRIAIEPNGLARAGRGFAPLQVGQTMQLVIDNPSEREFFKGYIIRFSTGGGNICYGGAGCTAGTTPVERLGVYTFEYFTNGRWLVSDLADDNHATTLTDVQTAVGGMSINVTMTGPESYTLVMDPLGAAPSYMQSGNLAHTGAGPIDWVEFVFFNTPTDPAKASDLYVSSMRIVPEPATGALAAGAGVAAVAMAAKHRRKSAK